MECEYVSLGEDPKKGEDCFLLCGSHKRPWVVDLYIYSTFCNENKLGCERYLDVMKRIDSGRL